MGTLFQSVAHIYTTTMFFFTITVLELVIFVRGSTAATSDHDNQRRRPMSKDQLLKLKEKIPARLHDAGRLGDELLELCAVCLSGYEDPDEVRKLRCKHAFHKECLDTWLRHDSATCPLCRRAVLSEEVVVKQRLHLDEEYYDGSNELRRLWCS